MPEPTAVSAAEKRLERAHADKEPPTPGEIHDERRATSDALARLIADHPAINMSPAEVLSACDHELDGLRDSAADLYPDRFGGEAGA